MQGIALPSTCCTCVLSVFLQESCTSKGHDQPQYAQYEGGEVELPA
jgi:hypothetical protein